MSMVPRGGGNNNAPPRLSPVGMGHNQNPGAVYMHPSPGVGDHAARQHPHAMGPAAAGPGPAFMTNVTPPYMLQRMPQQGLQRPPPQPIMQRPPQQSRMPSGAIIRQPPYLAVTTAQHTGGTGIKQQQATFSQGQATPPTSSAADQTPASTHLVSPKKLIDLVHEIDPQEHLDEDVKEVLLNIVDDFVDELATMSCQMAKHRHSNSLETKDVSLCLAHHWDMWIPGFGNFTDGKPSKSHSTSEAHKQRVALVKKQLKKL